METWVIIFIVLIIVLIGVGVTLYFVYRQPTDINGALNATWYDGEKKFDFTYTDGKLDLKIDEGESIKGTFVTDGDTKGTATFVDKEPFPIELVSEGLKLTWEGAEKTLKYAAFV